VHAASTCSGLVRLVGKKVISSDMPKVLSPSQKALLGVEALVLVAKGDWHGLLIFLNLEPLLDDQILLFWAEPFELLIAQNRSYLPEVLVIHGFKSFVLLHFLVEYKPLVYVYQAWNLENGSHHLESFVVLFLFVLNMKEHRIFDVDLLRHVVLHLLKLFVLIFHELSHFFNLIVKLLFLVCSVSELFGLDFLDYIQVKL
jgi:hypothetical protein